MNPLKLAVSSMTNYESFLSEGVPVAMKKLHELGAVSVEISQHIRFDQETIPEFLVAAKLYGMEICAISAQFDGTVSSPMPVLTWEGKALKTWSLERDFDELAALCKAFGCRYLRFAGFPGMMLTDPASVRDYMLSLENMCLRLKAHNLGLCVHNHADEFMQVEGRPLLDWAMELAPDLLMELDVLNAQLCGVNPCDLLRQYAGRIPLLHMQDYMVCPSGKGKEAWLKPEYRKVEVGSGNLNWPAIVRAASESGSAYLIVEQGSFYGKDPYTCIDKALRTLEAAAPCLAG